MESSAEDDQRLLEHKREVLVLVAVSLARYQKIEHLLKILVPQIEPPGSQSPQAASLDLDALLNVKTTLGMLAEEFRKSAQTNQPEEFKDYLRQIVAHRNELIHHFFHQPIGNLTDEEACREAADHLQSRHEYANGLLEALKGLVNKLIEDWDDPDQRTRADS